MYRVTNERFWRWRSWSICWRWINRTELAIWRWTFGCIELNRSRRQRWKVYKKSKWSCVEVDDPDKFDVVCAVKGFISGTKWLGTYICFGLWYVVRVHITVTLTFSSLQLRGTASKFKLKLVLTYIFQLVTMVVSFQFNCKNNPKILCTSI